MGDNHLSRTKSTRNKKLKWPSWVAIILLLIVVTVGIAKFTTFIQESRHEEAAAVTVKVNSEQIESGVYLQTESKEAETFTSFVTYPYTKIEDIDVPIYEWVQNQEQKFYNEMETVESMLGESLHSHFSMDTNVEKVNDNIYQLKLTSEQLVEEDNSYEELHTFIIDLENEKIISLNDMFHTDKFGEEGLYYLIQKQLKEENLDKAIDKENLNNNINNENYYWLFNHENLTIYFNPGGIGENEEIIHLSIPLISIYKQINKYYESIIISEELKDEIAKVEKEEEKRFEEERKKEEEEQKRLEEEERKKQEEEEQNDEQKGQSDTSQNNEEPTANMGAKKYVALTFDDVTHEVVTQRVLKTLREYNAKATFFMLGQNAANFPDIVKQVANEGHEIANHSISHANLNAVGADRIRQEMVDSLNQIENAGGVKPKLFRPPYGNYNDTVLNIAKETNQKVIMWSVDTRDWESRNANSVYEMVKAYTRPGSIVLMHDIHPTTADALPQIMEYLSSQGYEFVTVSQLLPYISGSGIGPYNGN